MTANARMTLTVAVACVLTSVGLYPLFKGTTWFYAGAGAVITVAACGALSRLRTLPVLVCLAIGAAGLLLYLNLLFEARHSLVIIPTPDSIRQLWALAGTGFSDTRQVRAAGGRGCRSCAGWSCSRRAGSASPPW